MEGSVWIKCVSELLGNLRVWGKIPGGCDGSPVCEQKREDLHMIMCFGCSFNITDASPTTPF